MDFSCFQSKGNQYEICCKKTIKIIRNLYISMKLANDAMHGCMFVTYIDKFKHIFVISTSWSRWHQYKISRPLWDHMQAKEDVQT